MGSVFIYIIKFIIEINTVIKLAHKQPRRWGRLFFGSASARAVAPLVFYVTSASATSFIHQQAQLGLCVSVG